MGISEDFSGITGDFRGLSKGLRDVSERLSGFQEHFRGVPEGFKKLFLDGSGRFYVFLGRFTRGPSKIPGKFRRVHGGCSGLK